MELKTRLFTYAAHLSVSREMPFAHRDNYDLTLMQVLPSTVLGVAGSLPRPGSTASNKMISSPGIHGDVGTTQR